MTTLAGPTQLASDLEPTRAPLRRAVRSMLVLMSTSPDRPRLDRDTGGPLSGVASERDLACLAPFPSPTQSTITHQMNLPSKNYTQNELTSFLFRTVC